MQRISKQGNYIRKNLVKDRALFSFSHGFHNDAVFHFFLFSGCFLGLLSTPLASSTPYILVLPRAQALTFIGNIYSEYHITRQYQVASTALGICISSLAFSLDHLLKHVLDIFQQKVL
jgi:hypothetical protein